jgi:hypothetical protein
MKKYKDIGVFVGLIVIVVAVFNSIAYMNRFKMNGDKFVRGIIMKEVYYRNDFVKIGYGYSLSCLGHYEIFKIKCGNKTIRVCNK